MSVTTGGGRNYIFFVGPSFAGLWWIAPRGRRLEAHATTCRQTHILTRGLFWNQVAQTACNRSSMARMVAMLLAATRTTPPANSIVMMRLQGGGKARFPASSTSSGTSQCCE